MADTKIDKVISGSQQQFYTRNSEIVNEWDGAVWNQVFTGVVGSPDDATYPDPPFTTLRSTAVSREMPFLYVNSTTGDPFVFVQDAAENTRGISWGNGLSSVNGTSIPLSDFHVVRSSSDFDVSVINQELASGKNLLLTPAVYDVGQSIVVDSADTVVLGLGLATLTAVDGAVPLKLGNNVPGIVVSGITIDAGTTVSPVLLQIGDPNQDRGDDVGNAHATNPITLSNVYFRLGGPHVGKASVCLEVNSDHVLIDHTWVWRADHGVEGFDTTAGFEGDNIRWATNIGTNGVIVNGNNVVATGLFVEHFQEYNLIWNGNGGKVYFFQNELPYEPANQAEWTNLDGTLGWAAYKVADSVTTHELWGGGVYCYNRNNPDIVTTNGFEVPDGDGIKLRRIMTRNLSGPGSILSVVNGVGDAVDSEQQGPSYVDKYPTTRS